MVLVSIELNQLITSLQDLNFKRYKEGEIEKKEVHCLRCRDGTSNLAIIGRDGESLAPPQPHIPASSASAVGERKWGRERNRVKRGSERDGELRERGSDQAFFWLNKLGKDNCAN